MASIIENLITELNDEYALYEQLLQVSMEKTGAIVSNNLDRLSETTEKEQRLADDLLRLTCQIAIHAPVLLAELPFKCINRHNAASDLIADQDELVCISGKNRFVHKLLCLQLRIFALLHCLPHIFMKIVDNLMSFFEICFGILELSLICTAYN